MDKVEMTLEALGEITDNHSEALLAAARRIKALEETTRRNAANIKELLEIIKDGQKVGKAQNEVSKALTKRVDLHDKNLKALSGGNLLRMQT